MLAARYMVSGKDIVSEAFDGDIVVLDLNSGKYFSFTDAGCGLWEALSAGAQPQSLVAPEAGRTTENLEGFLQKLLDHRLLSVRSEPIDFSPSAELMQKISAAQEQPDIFVFDDLADLFLADPIHDVEEPAGWPVIKKD